MTVENIFYSHWFKHTVRYYISFYYITVTIYKNSVHQCLLHDRITELF